MALSGTSFVSVHGLWHIPLCVCAFVRTCKGTFYSSLESDTIYYELTEGAARFCPEQRQTSSLFEVVSALLHA